MKNSLGGSAKADRTFYFLNLSHNFSDQIDWNYQGYGKLWNYNLQYFNYLNQNSLNIETKNSWLLEITDWLSDGRLKLEPYPVSIRIMNMIRYCSSQNELNPKIVSSIYRQTKYLSDHLEYHLLGNHLLENGFAMIMSGYAFREKAWKITAEKILFKELDEQVLDDGGHFELSPMYHQIILFRILELIDWYTEVEDQNPRFLEFIQQKAIKMLNWLKNMTFLNGDIPHFNDSSIGIALDSSLLFEYGQKLGLSGGSTSKLKGSGYRKFGSGIYECIVDVGAVGPSYQPGHSHADALSLVLYANQKPFIVDIGTSTYQIGEIRSQERSTAAHNTVTIGGANQSEVWGGFRVGKRAKVKVIRESDSQLVADHDGYLNNFGVLHQRSFIFATDKIEIFDDIGTSSGVLSFHFHPDCIVKVLDEKIVVIEGIGRIVLENISNLSLVQYDYANGYNNYIKANKLVANFRNSVKTSIHVNN
ncbi:alginate lyase family protein [Pedobacter foliorum]|uniref:alginate lyase family protein n=1 Tax=Pedobacter foliorum TaxID=2739058 RepID=UPI0015672BB2|nr:alginate lyase family protein [Pedobacter foliorum]NRF39203.1 alginate lyase family protein [Pedobacter foliorum]